MKDLELYPTVDLFNELKKRCPDLICAKSQIAENKEKVWSYFVQVDNPIEAERKVRHYIVPILEEKLEEVSYFEEVEDE